MGDSGCCWRACSNKAMAGANLPRRAKNDGTVDEGFKIAAIERTRAFEQGRSALDLSFEQSQQTQAPRDGSVVGLIGELRFPFFQARFQLVFVSALQGCRVGALGCAARINRRFVRARRNRCARWFGLARWANRPAKPSDRSRSRSSRARYNGHNGHRITRAKSHLAPRKSRQRKRT